MFLFTHTVKKIMGNLVRDRCFSIQFPHTAESLLHTFCLLLLESPKLFLVPGTQPRKEQIISESLMIQKFLFQITIKNTDEENNLHRGRNSTPLETFLILTCEPSLSASQHIRQEMNTVGVLSPDLIQHLFFNPSVKMTSEYFPVKDICEGNLKSVCQIHRDGIERIG